MAERWEIARAANDVDTMRAIHKEHPELFDEEVRTTPVAVDGALKWIAARGDDRDPYFLSLHVYDAHTPYTPPAPFDRRFDPDYTGTIDGRNLGGKDSPVHAGMDPRDLEHVVALYDGEIAAVDQELGRLLGELGRLGALENTLIVLTSDHGEEFFEHGGKLHGSTLYREALQVPMIVKWPGHIPAGGRSKENVGLVDIAPTLRAAAGLEPDRLLPGLDMLSLAANKERPPAESVLLGQVTIRRGVDQPLWLESLVEQHQHTIIRRPGTADWSAERYDLRVDPRELGPPEWIDASHPTSPALLSMLEVERKKLRLLRELAPQRALPGTTVSPEDSMRLRALGYGGTELSGAFKDEFLCLDGCIWRP